MPTVCPTCGVEDPHHCHGAIAARHAEAERIVAAVFRNLRAQNANISEKRSDWAQTILRTHGNKPDRSANFRARL